MAFSLRRIFRWVLPEDPAHRRHSTGRPALVIPFRGYGHHRSLWLQGRVLRDRLIRVKPDDTVWRNLANNYKRFGSLAVSGALLDLHIGQNRLQVISDDQGYFHYAGTVEHPLCADPGEPCMAYSLHLLGTLQEDFDYRNTGEILVPENTSYGIISDIDDTIIKTGLTSLLKLKALYLTLAKNAFGRQAFQSVGDFYRALQAGPEGTSQNPVFYVSNGPWNLYDLLSDFQDLNDLPRGPILLRDFSLRRRLFSPPRNHKPDTIARIMDTYPELPFILIGDSGERDTDVYMELSRSYPGRILGIFIRDVDIPGRAAKIQRLIAERRDEVKVYIIKNYREAANFARSSGWIAALPPHS